MSRVGLFDENGNPTNPDDFGRRLEKHRNASLVNQVKQKLTGVICPEHHQQPTVAFVGSQLSISNCCDKLQELVNEKMNSAR